MNSIGATIALPFVLPFVGIGYINDVYNKYKTKKHLEIVLAKYGIQNLVYDEDLFICALYILSPVPSAYSPSYISPLLTLASSNR